MRGLELSLLLAPPFLVRQGYLGYPWRISLVRVGGKGGPGDLGVAETTAGAYSTRAPGVVKLPLAPSPSERRWYLWAWGGAHLVLALLYVGARGSQVTPGAFCPTRQR